jgi:nitroimidazol reductase NimA-like FMN-containing flavoprotein (pyridoxamine 5'-phosphate oxidase superfamily)
MATGELTELTLDECRSLLERHHFGRLAFMDRVGELPMIIPVNYVFRDGVILRSNRGSKLRAALANVGAAFEIDGTDERQRTGWSVVVRGRVAEVDDPDEIAELEQLPPDSWAPGDRPHYIRLNPSLITGRRISITDLPDNWLG